MARLEAGRQSLTSAFGAEQAVSRAVRYRPDRAEQGVAVRVDVRAEVTWRQTPGGRTHPYNPHANAVKFAPEGGEVFHRPPMGAERIHLTVEDNGP